MTNTSKAVTGAGAPLDGNPADAIGEAQERELFLRRAPLLDRQENLVGWELQTDEVDLGLPESGLLSLYAALEINRIAEHKLLLARIDARALQSDALLDLPKESLILAVRNAGAVTPAMVARLREAWAQGFCLALDDLLYTRENEYLLATAAYVRLDVPRFNALELARETSLLLEKAGVRLIAMNIRSRDEFDACRALPFDYYQGRFFGSTQAAAQGPLTGERREVIDLLNKVARKAEVVEIEHNFRRDPALAYRMLRYINSPGLGLNREIRSIGHALIVLGYDQLYRWLTLLLFGSEAGQPRDRGLLAQALVRARLCEILGVRMLGPKQRDALFILGAFSMLDALLGMPLAQALGQIRLPPAITEALVDRSGPLASCFALALACETGGSERIRDLALAADLDPGEVNAAQVEALLWAESVM